MTVPASLGQAVQKYGRSTSLTHGTITGLNATVTVNYGSSGNATFVNQIIVSSSRSFIQAGDSGSLLVTDDPDANPIDCCSLEVPAEPWPSRIILTMSCRTSA